MYTQVNAEWITTTLASDSEVSAIFGDRIYEDQIPERDDEEADPTDLFPCIVFKLMATNDVTTNNGAHIIFADSDYAVFCCYGPDKIYADILPGYRKVHKALQRKSGSTADGRVSSCVRNGELRSPGRWQGVDYPILGGHYNLLTEIPE